MSSSANPLVQDSTQTLRPAPTPKFNSPLSLNPSSILSIPAQRSLVAPLIHISPPTPRLRTSQFHPCFRSHSPSSPSHSRLLTCSAVHLVVLSVFVTMPLSSFASSCAETQHRTMRPRAIGSP